MVRNKIKHNLPIHDFSIFLIFTNTSRIPDHLSESVRYSRLIYIHWIEPESFIELTVVA